MSLLDTQACEALSRHVEALTTQGGKQLNEVELKKLKKLCKTSDEYVKHAYYLLMTQLEKQHAEIRYSTVLVIKELFKRSHVFRELLLSNFQTFLDLAAETNPDEHLPPPKHIAKDLKLKTLELVQEWTQEYSQGYKKLALAYNYLRQCKKVDFNHIDTRNHAQLQQEEEQRQHLENIMQEKVNRAQKEMQDQAPEIYNILIQLETCFQLLLPPPDTLFTSADWEKSVTQTLRLDNTDNPGTKCGTSFAGCEDPEDIYCKNKDLSKSRDIKDNNQLLPSSEIAIENSKTVVRTNHFKPDQQQIENRTSTSKEEEDINVLKEFSSEGNSLRHHGLRDKMHKIDIEIPKDGGVTVKENENNSTVLENLDDLYCQIIKFLPVTLKWIQIFTKGSNCTDSLKKAIDLKQLLRSSIEKYEELKIEKKHDKESKDDSDEDEDFEEVEEKEGYEPVIPPHMRNEYATGISPQLPKTSKYTHPTTSRQWSVKDKNQDEDKDPTSWITNIKALCTKMSNSNQSSVQNTKEDSSPSTSKDLLLHSKNTQDPVKAKLLAKAPHRPYDIDLYHWEEEKLEVPTVVKFDSLHKFWQPIENETTEFQAQEGIASLRRRAIDFSGEFVPVKWKCNAPLTNGKLCPRQDRFKCPFHGPIITRDEKGNAVNSESKYSHSQESQPSTSSGKQPDWQDPDLLRDIEAATGINLELPHCRGKSQKGKGKGKKSKKKYPGLINIKTYQNTTRKRLSKKVFKKSSLKRVAEAMDAMDKKKFLDKFGNQFNYAFSNFT
ncbi:UV-stimulated scaffold protein A-like isoform X1 [Limulus polyphemus]|uniref:UV-stimulated scaffold protein A-like isoform X1 n=1 Tax=Limulus polyphemus TaxID=6850 RepID=A0ABM1SD52_LIMPO|nr:UV-stimulated scaffold protein A-like isoform X1 [Limulus polyphemus]